LRAVRFAACLGFGIEEKTAAAIFRSAPLLANVAGERIGKEILKMASRPGAALADGVELLDRFGMLEPLLPEVKGLQGLPQPAVWHPEGDVWAHTLAALRASPSADPAVNLAVLLHDAGKRPAHRQEGGRHRYHGHEGAGGGLADAVARRLFLPQRLRAAIGFAVERHLQAARIDELRRSKRLALVTGEHWPVLRALALCDRAARGDAAALSRLDAAFLRAEADAAACGVRPGGPAALSGTRVMELTGLAPGPRVGEIRRRVSEWALDNRVDDPLLIEAEVARVFGTPEGGAR
jgi:tRNA nucleotidyltransferase/poly(A) polymerase